MSSRFRRIDAVVHHLADAMCWVSESPELESVVVRELRTLALRLLWAVWRWR